jgi:tetratricopeptide (TPR) repeat protein
VDVLDNDIASDFSHFGGQFDSFDDPLPRVQQERDFDGSDIDDDFEEPPQELVAWLDACTMLSCDPIPRRLIQAGFDVDKEAALSGLDKLNSDGWVRISQERDTFIIPITRRRLRRQQLEAFDKAASSARIALTAIVATFKQVSSDSASRPKRTVYERILLRHIDACLEIYQKWKAVLDCEWDVLAEVCEKHGLFEEASTFFQAARDYPLDRNDSQGHLSSSFITGLERVTNDDGWDETESMISADQRKLTEPSHPTPTVHKAKSFRELQSELGRIRMQVVLGRFRDLNKQCEDMLKEIEYGQDDGRFRKLKIEALRQMVSITNAQHDWTKSIETSYELIGMLERELGPSADDTVWAVHELARIHLSQEDYGGAEPLLEQVLMVRQREFGNSYPGTIAVSEDLARSYREQGQLNNALDAYLRILKIYRDLFGEEHIQTAKVKENLAIVRDMMGKHEAADHLYDSALHVAGLLGVESEDYQAMLERYDNRQKAIQEKQEEEKMLEEERVGMASVNPAIPSRTDSTPSAWVMVKSISAFQSKAGR